MILTFFIYKNQIIVCFKEIWLIDFIKFNIFFKIVKLWHAILIIFNKSLNNNEMKPIFKKMIFASALLLAGITLAQYSPNDNYGGNNQYQYYYDDYNYPEDYYYEYPSDYYTNDFYRGYYDDYRRAVVSVNWDRFFVEFRLSPWQIREIRILNNRFTSYSFWFNYYRYNPDRWYYDRFVSLERILGPRIYVVFYQRYYNNYNPIVYFRNYRVKHYRPVIYVTPRYRNVDVRSFRNDDFRKGNFRTNGNNKIDRDNNSFRNDNRPQDNGRGFRTDQGNNAPNNEGFRKEKDNFTKGPENNRIESPRNNGFRDDAPKKSEELNRMNNESRSNGGFRGGDNNRSNGADKSHKNDQRGFR